LALDPARSTFLGDSITDMQAGKAGGIGNCLWLTEKPEGKIDGVTVVNNFDEALKALN
jgi:histidinol phosphatase-like enzyme